MRVDGQGRAEWYAKAAEKGNPEAISALKSLVRPASCRASFRPFLALRFRPSGMTARPRTRLKTLRTDHTRFPTRGADVSSRGVEQARMRRSEEEAKAPAALGTVSS